MFSIITSIVKKLKEQKCFEILIFNQINLLFLLLYVNLKPEELRGHKVVAVLDA